MGCQGQWWRRDITFLCVIFHRNNCDSTVKHFCNNSNAFSLFCIFDCINCFDQTYSITTDKEQCVELGTLLLTWSPLTAMGYMTNFPPSSSLGAQEAMLSGSCSAPKLWPSSWVVTKSASCGATSPSRLVIVELTAKSGSSFRKVFMFSDHNKKNNELMIKKCTRFPLN